jgi:hypothetical protein
LLFEADGDDIAEGQIDEFRGGRLCVAGRSSMRTASDRSTMPRCSTSQGTGCARASAIAALSAARSVSPTIIVVSLPPPVHRHRVSRAGARRERFQRISSVFVAHQIGQNMKRPFIGCLVGVNGSAAAQLSRHSPRPIASRQHPSAVTKHEEPRRIGRNDALGFGNVLEGQAPIREKLIPDCVGADEKTHKAASGVAGSEPSLTMIRISLPVRLRRFVMAAAIKASVCSRPVQ